MGSLPVEIVLQSNRLCKDAFLFCSHIAEFVVVFFT